MNYCYYLPLFVVFLFYLMWMYWWPRCVVCIIVCFVFDDDRFVFKIKKLKNARRSFLYFIFETNNAWDNNNSQANNDMMGSKRSKERKSKEPTAPESNPKRKITCATKVFTSNKECHRTPLFTTWRAGIANDRTLGRMFRWLFPAFASSLQTSLFSRQSMLKTL